MGKKADKLAQQMEDMNNNLMGFDDMRPKKFSLQPKEEITPQVKSEAKLEEGQPVVPVVKEEVVVKHQVVKKEEPEVVTSSKGETQPEPKDTVKQSTEVSSDVKETMQGNFEGVVLKAGADLIMKHRKVSREAVLSVDGTTKQIVETVQFVFEEMSGEKLNQMLVLANMVEYYWKDHREEILAIKDRIDRKQKKKLSI